MAEFSAPNGAGTKLNETQRLQFQLILRMLNAGISVNVPSEHELRVTLDLLKALAPDLDDPHFDQIFDEVAKTLSISMDTGVLIEASDHTPWVSGRRGDIDWRQWEAYSRWQINSGRSPVVVDALDRSLDIILDHMGDPADQGAWGQRGLVIGDVQSGKTGTYIGLMDKAADAGYRIFILLTGNTESLRQQTQSRVDQGFIGRDSMSIGRVSSGQKNKPNAVGIGKLLTSTSSAFNMTTMTTDFRKNSIQAVDISPGPENLVVFVTKKNKTVLDRIADWLERQDNVNGKLQLPLLLIDDESDFASINTRNLDESPTAINAGIRRLLGLFSRSSYVGFTATPFANIFIDDEQAEDLFPKDFIFGLEAPSNYVGPQSLFGAEVDPNEDLPWHVIDDAEDAFPLKHKSTFEVAHLPETLEYSIRTYLIANAIRDIRGQEREPRAMLINVSRYNAVQSQVFEMVTEELAGYKFAIQLHAKAYERGVDNPDLAALEETYTLEYSDSEVSWPEVLSMLAKSTTDIQTLLVNSKTDRKLEQDELSASPPPRVIAIGGDLLSRGLTLDGLTTSYFFRRSVAADTLMQMGRWFGYREGYGDLCRIWIDSEMVSAYAHAADSLDELRLELKRMRDQKLTPAQYGLAVANHPGSLLITARNKMRAASIGQKQISLRGRSIESYKLSSDPKVLKQNFEATKDLIEAAIDSNGRPSTPNRNRPTWYGVDKAVVADFLGIYQAHESFELFQPGALEKFVRTAVAEDLQTWDIVLMGGDGTSLTIAGVELNRPVRTLVHSLQGAWLVGERQRVAGPRDISTPLSEKTILEVSAKFAAHPSNAGKKSVPDKEFVYALERPALLIYPILPKIEGQRRDTAVPFVAVLIAMPGDPTTLADPGRDGVTYVLNKPAQRLWFPEFADTTLEDENDV